MAKLKNGVYIPRKKGSKMRTTPQHVARRTLAQRCLELRREGYTNATIADMLNEPGGTLDEGKVAGLILGELNRMGRAATEDVRTEELDRLDRIFNRALSLGLSDKARDRVPALNAALKAMERRAALLGLDAPKQIDLKDDRQHVPPATAIEEVLARLAQEADKERPAGGSEAAGPADGDQRPA